MEKLFYSVRLCVQLAIDGACKVTYIARKCNRIVAQTRCRGRCPYRCSLAFVILWLHHRNPWGTGGISRLIKAPCLRCSCLRWAGRCNRPLPPVVPQKRTAISGSGTLPPKSGLSIASELESCSSGLRDIEPHASSQAQNGAALNLSAGLIQSTFVENTHPQGWCMPTPCSLFQSEVSTCICIYRLLCFSWSRPSAAWPAGCIQ
jgi:hypothetical protein